MCPVELDILLVHEWWYSYILDPVDMYVILNLWEAFEWVYSREKDLEKIVEVIFQYDS